MPTIIKPDLYEYYERHLTWTGELFSPNGNPSITRINTGIGSGTLVTTRNKNPDWRQRLAKRQDVSSAYYVEGWSKPIEIGTAEILVRQNPPIPKRWTTASLTSLGLGPFASIPASVKTSVQDQANSKIKRKLAKRVGDMQLMAPLAELTELRSTIKGTASMVTDLIKSLIDIKRTKGQSAFKYAADSWLTFGFGIAPVVGDTIKLCQSIQSFLDRKDRTERLSGTARSEWTSSQKAIGGLPIGGFPVYSDWDIRHTYSCRYVAGFELLLKSSNSYGLADHLHFEWQALIPVFWELMAYSWVYDYFTTTGAYLDDVFTSDPSRCIYVVMNERYTASLQGTTRIGNSSGIILENTPGYHNGEYYSFRRTPLTTLPNRALRFKTVDEIGLHSVNKLLNLTSVLLQGSKYQAYYRPFETSRASFYDSQGATRRSETNRFLSRL